MRTRDMILNSLPDEATLTPTNELTWGGQTVARFVPCVTNLVEDVTDGYPETYVRFVCLFANDEESRAFTIKLAELERVNWPTLDSRCLLDPDCSTAKAHLIYVIRFMFRSAPTIREYHITRTGFHEIEGVKFYSAGDKILWPPGAEGKLNVVLELQTHRMPVDLDRYSERDAFLGMAELISFTPDAGRIMEAHAITGLTWAAYEDVGIVSNSVLEVTAPSGSMKTTYTPLLVQPYNRDEEIKPETRFNSSHRFIEELLHDNCEFTTVIDDLHTAASRTIKRKNEEAKEEITRRIGDNTGRGRMAGNHAVQQNPRGNAIFLGEYETGVQSTAARGLVINFARPDGRKLVKFQREPLLISTFYYYFLIWYITNFDDIRDSLAKLLAEYRDTDWGDIHLRLQTTRFCLHTGYVLFWQYALDKGFVDASVARNELQDFWALLTKLANAQNKRISTGADNDSSSVDFFELVRGWYSDGAFNLAADGWHMRGRDGFEHKGFLCLRGDRLMKKIHKIMPTATPNEVRQSFLSHKALWLDSEGKNKRVRNQRVIGIPLKKLK